MHTSKNSIVWVGIKPHLKHIAGPFSDANDTGEVFWKWESSFFLSMKASFFLPWDEGEDDEEQVCGWLTA